MPGEVNHGNEQNGFNHGVKALIHEGRGSAMQFSHELDEISEHMAMCFIASLAKGGWNPSHAHDDPIKKAIYNGRKLDDGMSEWGDMRVDAQDSHLQKKLVLCECVEFEIVGKRKTPTPFVDDECPLCGGEGLRKATKKEIGSLRYRIRKWGEQYERDHRGDGCCVEYVMQSQDVQEEYGCWEKPRAWDGVTRNRLRHQIPVPTQVVKFPVKMYKGTKFVGIVEKEVSVPIRENKCRDNWKPVQVLICEQQTLLRNDLEKERSRSGDGDVIEGIVRKIGVVQRLLSKLSVYGDCSRNEQEVQMLLPPDAFERVAKLWR